MAAEIPTDSPRTSRDNLRRARSGACEGIGSASGNGSCGPTGKIHRARRGSRIRHRVGPSKCGRTARGNTGGSRRRAGKERRGGAVRQNRRQGPGRHAGHRRAAAHRHGHGQGTAVADLRRAYGNSRGRIGRGEINTDVIEFNLIIARTHAAAETYGGGIGKRLHGGSRLKDAHKIEGTLGARGRAQGNRIHQDPGRAAALHFQINIFSRIQFIGLERVGHACGRDLAEIDAPLHIVAVGRIGCVVEVDTQTVARHQNPAGIGKAIVSRLRPVRRPRGGTITARVGAVGGKLVFHVQAGGILRAVDRRHRRIPAVHHAACARADKGHVRAGDGIANRQVLVQRVGGQVQIDGIGEQVARQCKGLVHGLGEYFHEGKVGGGVVLPGTQGNNILLRHRHGAARQIGISRVNKDKVPLRTQIVEGILPGGIRIAAVHILLGLGDTIAVGVIIQGNGHVRQRYVNTEVINAVGVTVEKDRVADGSGINALEAEIVDQTGAGKIENGILTRGGREISLALGGEIGRNIRIRFHDIHDVINARAGGKVAEQVVA